MSKSVLKLAEGRKQSQEGAGAKTTRPISSRKRTVDETITEDAPISVNSNKKVKLSANLRPIEPSSKSSMAVVKTSKTSEGGKIIYLGHIPEGFNEKLMRKFFNQYGEVSQIKLFKSLKTGRSKGYAFVEFESPEVAAIASESMNGYFLMERKLVSHVVPADKIHKGMFAKPKVEPSRRKNSFSSDDEEDAPTVDESNFARVAALHAKSMEKKQAKLAELGIEFDIPFAKPVDTRTQPEEVAEMQTEKKGGKKTKKTK
ncbi:hypothetical protein EON65_48495 [archaeon]|nr:MAG: hypothetical protein EON65_48495 [archaeon]